MRSFLILLGICIFFTTTAFASAQSGKMFPQIKIENKVFELKYSNCSQESETCMNEYYNLKDNAYNDTEIITIHYFKKQKSPLEYVKKLQSVTPFSQLIFDEKKNSAMLSFMVPYTDENTKNKEIKYIEQSILRVDKYKKKKGLIAIQYAYRHPYKTKEQQQKAKILTKNIQNKYANIIDNIKIPEIILEPIKKL